METREGIDDSRNACPVKQRQGRLAGKGMLASSTARTKPRVLQPDCSLRRHVAETNAGIELLLCPPEPESTNLISSGAPPVRSVMADSRTTAPRGINYL